MALIIGSNVPALEIQQNITRSSDLLSGALQRLSSGYRINSAADDAAGIAISESLLARIQSFNQAERNANYAISMTSTAEGGLGEISSVIVRMREIAVQASNGDLTLTDRSYLDTEYQELLSEVTRLSEATEFRDTELLAGTLSSVSFQVGIDSGTNDLISVQFGGISISAIGIAGSSVSGGDATNANAAISAADSALTSVSTRRASFGGAINRLAYAVSNISTINTNLAAANSAIRDVDVAEETTVLARAQVLLQAGTSVLATANQLPSYALDLLKS